MTEFQYIEKILTGSVFGSEYGFLVVLHSFATENGVSWKTM